MSEPRAEAVEQGASALENDSALESDSGLQMQGVQARRTSTSDLQARRVRSAIGLSSGGHKSSMRRVSTSSILGDSVTAVRRSRGLSTEGILESLRVHHRKKLVSLEAVPITAPASETGDTHRRRPSTLRKLRDLSRSARPTGICMRRVGYMCCSEVTADGRVSQQPADRYTIHPRSRFAIGWNFFIMVLILYMSAVVPLELAFSNLYSTSSNFEQFRYVTGVILWIDLFLSFLTGYQRSDGNVVMTYRKIAIRYFKGYFIIDLLSSITLFVDIAEQGGQSSTYSTTSKLFKVAKLLRVVRGVQLFDVSGPLGARLLNSAVLRVSTKRLLIFAVAIVIVSHTLACVWLFIGTLPDVPPDSTWVVASGLSDTAEHRVLYLHAFYWAVTTLTTVGYGDITPGNENEIVVCILTLYMGVLLYAALIGAVTDYLSETSAAKRVSRDQAQAIENFCVAAKIPLKLRQRIWESHRRSFHSKYVQTINESSRDIIDDMEPELKTDVIYHIHGWMEELLPCFFDPRHTIMTKHHFAQAFLALQRYRADPGETLMQFADPLKGVIFVATGALNLAPPGDSLDDCADNVIANGENALNPEDESLTVEAHQTYGMVLVLSGGDASSDVIASPFTVSSERGSTGFIMSKEACIKLFDSVGEDTQRLLLDTDVEIANLPKAPQQSTVSAISADEDDHESTGADHKSIDDGDRVIEAVATPPRQPQLLPARSQSHNSSLEEADLQWSTVAKASIIMHRRQKSKRESHSARAQRLRMQSSSVNYAEDEEDKNAQGQDHDAHPKFPLQLGEQKLSKRQSTRSLLRDDLKRIRVELDRLLQQLEEVD